MRLFRPFARRMARTLPASPSRRYVTAGMVALLGIGLSLLAWARAVGERRSELTGMLSGIADETTSGIEWQMGREVDALRTLGTYWQMHGARAEDTWRFEAGMVLDHFPGIQWIAWVTADSAGSRMVSRDTLAHMTPDILTQARFERASPVNVVLDRWAEAYFLDVLQPVHSAGESLGVLVGEIRVDSLWLKRRPALRGNLSISLLSAEDHRLDLRSLPDSAAPAWMRIRRTVTSPAGSALRVDMVPSDDFVRQVATPWPLISLVVGAGLSFAIGVLLFQFLRMRDYSGALARTNQDLDAHLADLSRRDHALRELNEALERRVQSRTTELSQALRDVEAFSHSISHDLRSPVGAILNFTAVLEEDYGGHLDSEGRRLLGRVRAAAGRANQLLDALVELAATGSAPEEARALNMQETAQLAFNEAAGHEGRTDDVRFTVGELPLAWADPARVHRVFVNLIGNALKYARGRTPRNVEVGGERQAEGCLYWVRDNGPGFEPARAAELFEPFRRLHGSEVEGAGLGLAIVAKIVGVMGGRVWAESDGEHGATFYFTLPGPERRVDDPTARTGRG